MSKRGWMWVWGIGALAFMAMGGIVLLSKSHAASDESAFQEQLRLARAEGIPTNAAEYAALIPKVPPSENAAPYYRKLVALRLKAPKSKSDPVELNEDLIFTDKPATVASARAFLASHRQALDAVDEAVKRPKCWFDRDWSEGGDVLLPELSEMKSAAKLLALRGSLSASQGNVAAALEDVRRLEIMSRHAGSEPHGISHFVREATDFLAIRNLAYWSFAHRDQPEYSRALAKSVNSFPSLNLKEEHSSDLYQILCLLEESSTPEGRKKMGWKEKDVRVPEEVAPILHSRTKARVQIVKAERDYWRALGCPQAERSRLITEATDDRYSAILAYPTAQSFYATYGPDEEETISREPKWKARLQTCTAAVRALQGKAIPTSIRTNDLLSPFDGKPLSYRYDGKQIVIGVSGYENDGKPVLLKIPPDRLVGK